MKSHIVEQKVYVTIETQKEADVSDRYKQRITNAIIAAVMLAANETWHIGEKRMCPMLENLAEWLDYFSEYMNDGVGFEILEKRLTERGLYALYDELILSKNITEVEQK